MSFYDVPEVFLEFRYLKNHMIDLGDGQQYPIPMQMRPREVNGYKITVPVFDLKHIHKIRLLNETPMVPLAEEAATQRQYEDMKEDAFTEARKNRLANDNLRRRVYNYVTSGVVEIVNDPFAMRRLPASASGPKKPSEIAAEIDDAAKTGHKTAQARENIGKGDKPKAK